MLGEIFSSISAIDKVIRWIKVLIPNKSQPEIETIASRFIKIFESHAVNRNQIPRFFGHGLTIADVQRDEVLLTKLTEEMLIDACKIFAIRREWLDGEDSQIYPLHDFYKKPEEFDNFLKKLGPVDNYRVEGELLVVENKSRQLHDDALLVLEEIIGELNDRPIYRYHICYNWVITYWKARVYMAACIAAADRNNVHVNGRYISEEYFKKYHAGRHFFEYPFSNAWGAMPPPTSTMWYPDRLLEDPDFFINGIDEGFGMAQGLRFWLDLEKEGLLKGGEYIKPAKERFAEALAAVKVTNEITD